MAHRTEYPPESTLQWTDRQRQVLDLLARGLSNAEIADRLGVSLAGAKWHVSEVISKLGVDSREEVADYWREHRSLRSRARRSVHGLASLLSLKAVGGAAAATAVAGAAVVGYMIVSAGDGDERPLAVEASPTPTEVPTPTTAAAFVPEVPPPDWWVPPSAPSVAAENSCLTGLDNAVGIGLLVVPDNEFYFVLTRGTVSPDAGNEYACIAAFSRFDVAFDDTGNLLPSNGPGPSVGGSFHVLPQDGPSCGFRRAPRGPLLEPPATLTVHCSVSTRVAYAVVDDGTPERVDATDLPTGLGFERRAILAAHRTYGPVVLELFDGAGNLIERLTLAAPTIPVVPEVPPPDWFTAELTGRNLAGELCGEFDDFIGVDAFEFEGEGFYVVLNPDPPGPFTDPDTVCLRHYTQSGGAGGGSYHVSADRPAGCGFASGGPPPHLHFVQCSVPLGVEYAIFDDGSPARADAIDFPSALGLLRRGIFTQASSSDGAMTIYLYDADDALIETLEYFPLP
jgi:DNA-binding CsgD family transcriptional regulator